MAFQPAPPTPAPKPAPGGTAGLHGPVIPYRDRQVSELQFEVARLQGWIRFIYACGLQAGAQSMCQRALDGEPAPEMENGMAEEPRPPSIFAGGLFAPDANRTSSYTEEATPRLRWNVGELQQLWIRRELNRSSNKPAEVAEEIWRDVPEVSSL